MRNTFLKNAVYTPNFYEVQRDLEMTREWSDDSPLD